jgi:hypothetical protein
MLIVGSIFFVQGVGLLPGSVMTGQTIWAVIGAVVVAGGMGVIVWAHRRGLAPRQ